MPVKVSNRSESYFCPVSNTKLDLIGYERINTNRNNREIPIFRCPQCQRYYTHIDQYPKTFIISFKNARVFNSSTALNHTVIKQKINDPGPLWVDRDISPYQNSSHSDNLPTSTGSKKTKSGGSTNKNRHSVTLDIKQNLADENKYCMVELQDKSTFLTKKYTVSKSSVPEASDRHNIIVSLGSDMATECLKIAANGYRITQIDGRIYSVLQCKIYNDAIVGQYKNKPIKQKPLIKNPPTASEPPKPIGTIATSRKKQAYDNETIYVYYKLTNTCTTQKHPVEALSLEAPCVNRSVKSKINVFYCSKCQKYYINYEALDGYLKKKTVPAFKYEIVSGTTLNPISKLKLYGYSAGANTKAGQRQGTLAWIINNGLMGKHDVIANLQYFINFIGKKASNKYAKEKWEEDLDFVTHYTVGNTGVMKDGVFVRKIK